MLHEGHEANLSGETRLGPLLSADNSAKQVAQLKIGRLLTHQHQRAGKGPGIAPLKTSCWVFFAVNNVYIPSGAPKLYQPAGN